MNIKTFKAESLQDGLRRIHEEFGENAKIMHTREVDEKRFFGLLRKRFVEITAAESDTFERTGTPERPQTAAFDARNSNEDFLQQLFEAPRISAIPVRSDIASDIVTEKIVAPPEPEKPVLEPKNVDTTHWRRLRVEQLNPSLLQRNLIAKFEENICFGNPIEVVFGRKKIAAMVGPTGVGKTATIAKIAAHYKFKEHKNVGLLSTDLFRIAAADQLHKYADMIRIPFLTVAEAHRMPGAIDRLGDCDLILIDTPGVSPRNEARLEMIRDFLESAKVEDIQLVLSATSSTAVFSDVVERFSSRLSLDALCLTKLDEAASLGDLYHFFKTNPLPLRYFTLGQNIAEDIELAGPVRLAALA